MNTEKLRHPELNALYTWWVAQGGSDGLPSAADLSPSMLRRWLDNLVVVDALADGCPRYAYYGANLTLAFGTDMVGRSIEELPLAQRQILEGEYQALRTERRPLARHYTADFGGSVQTWERLLLPFFDADGVVEKALVAVYRVL